MSTSRRSMLKRGTGDVGKLSEDAKKSQILFNLLKMKANGWTERSRNCEKVVVKNAGVDYKADNEGVDWVRYNGYLDSKKEGGSTELASRYEALFQTYVECDETGEAAFLLEQHGMTANDADVKMNDVENVDAGDEGGTNKRKSSVLSDISSDGNVVSMGDASSTALALALKHDAKKHSAKKKASGGTKNTASGTNKASSSVMSFFGKCRDKITSVFGGGDPMTIQVSMGPHKIGLSYAQWLNVLGELGGKIMAQVRKEGVEDETERIQRFNTLDKMFHSGDAMLPNELAEYKKEVYDPARKELLDAIREHAQECAKQYELKLIDQLVEHNY